MRVCSRDDTHTETRKTAALGHDWGEWQQTKEPTCAAEGESERVCRRDASHRETAKEAANPNAHDWGEASYKWSDDNSEVTAERICRNDKSHKETETVTAASSITKEPTATEEGELTYTATFENSAFEKQVKIVKIPALAQYTVTFVDWDGTALQSSRAAYGETPSYTGETPTRAADEQYTYTFAGWDPEIIAVTEDATYTATYIAEETIGPMPIVYTVTEYTGSFWIKGNGDTYTITVKRSENDAGCFSHFTGVLIDGEPLATADYEAGAGSTVVTIKAYVLDALSAGTHTITITFDDGEAEIILTVEEETPSIQPEKPDSRQPKAPATGDNSNMGIWILLMIISILGLGCLAAFGMKRRGVNK